MRSRWSRAGGEGQHPPVEMRFVDMFMTALGSLIFIAMLLVFLLPKAAQPSTVDPSVDPAALAAELARVRQELSREQQSLRDLQRQLENVSQVDKHVVKRWLSVTLLTKGCEPFEPKLYVRWEGPISNFNTGQHLGKLDAFDAGAPRTHPLMGNRTFFIGPAALTALPGVGPTPLLDGTGLVMASFFAVSNGPGDRSIYVGLSDPRGLKGGECIVQPIIHGWSGQTVESAFRLSLAQPFAWIRRVRLENDGGFTSPSPKYDAGFQRELEIFSAEQSKKLCDRKLICGTQDAHWARYAKPPPPPEILEWKLDYRFASQDDRFAVKSPMTAAECEKACIDEPLCAAVEYDNDRNSCALYDEQPSVKSAPGSRRSVGIRPPSPSPLRWLVDRAVAGDKVYRSLVETSQEDCAKACLDDASCKAVEYYKPTRACSLFASVPKIVPSPIGAYGPTDVGVRTGR